MKTLSATGPTLCLVALSCASSMRAPAAPAAPSAMVPIPNRTFVMGSPEGVGARQEHPAHTVTVPAFELDATLVTVSAYAACVRSGACTPAGNSQRGTPGASVAEDAFCNGSHPERADDPINCVDWSQAVAYCASVGKRLPTEEEWESAARGPDDRLYPWGQAAPSTQVCWNRLQGEDYAHAGGTCAVGSHPTGDSGFGAHDMVGNVWVWTSTVWIPAYDAPRDPTARVVRGGGWRDADPAVLRGANRNGSDLPDRVINLGFRCAK
jgi:formylglycine-generating enzyme required for sulfatase activity